MNKRLLGKTGLRVSELGFGAMEIGKLDYTGAEQLLNQVLDNGINFIDSSPCYGLAEEYVGRAISHRRDEFILATKSGCNVDDQGQFTLGADHIWTREQMFRNIDRSLTLLKTDHIDIWQLHGIMPEFLPDGQNGAVMRAAEEIKQSGRVSHIAFSCRNGGPSQEFYPALFGYHACKEFMTWDKFEVIQLIYGALTRTNEEVIHAAANQNTGIICRGIVKQYFDYYDRLFDEAHLTELFEAGDDKISFLIRFALSHTGIGTMIIGTKDINHLVDNVKAAEMGILKPEIYEQAKKRLTAVGVTVKPW